MTGVTYIFRAILPQVLAGRVLLYIYLRYEHRGYQCPYHSFPFPHYHPDTGTGSDYPNRTFVELLTQPLFKQASPRLTALHACDPSITWSQPAASTHADALLPQTVCRLYTFWFVRWSSWAACSIA